MKILTKQAKLLSICKSPVTGLMITSPILQIDLGKNYQNISTDYLKMIPWEFWATCLTLFQAYHKLHWKIILYTLI